MIDDFYAERGVNPRAVWSAAPADAQRASHFLLAQHREEAGAHDVGDTEATRSRTPPSAHGDKLVSARKLESARQALDALGAAQVELGGLVAAIHSVGCKDGAVAEEALANAAAKVHREDGQDIGVGLKALTSAEAELEALCSVLVAAK